MEGATLLSQDSRQLGHCRLSHIVCPFSIALRRFIHCVTASFSFTFPASWGKIHSSSCMSANCLFNNSNCCLHTPPFSVRKPNDGWMMCRSIQQPDIIRVSFHQHQRLATETELLVTTPDTTILRRMAILVVGQQRTVSQFQFLNINYRIMLEL